MGSYRCFLCNGAPVTKVPEGEDAWQASHQHYLEVHYVPPR